MVDWENGTRKLKEQELPDTRQKPENLATNLATTNQNNACGTDCVASFFRNGLLSIYFTSLRNSDAARFMSVGNGLKIMALDSMIQVLGLTELGSKLRRVGTVLQNSKTSGIYKIHSHQKSCTDKFFLVYQASVYDISCH